MLGFISKSRPSPAVASMSKPLPGSMRLPTSSPTARANVDMTMKYVKANPPALPTEAAARTEPMPKTIVQKITGEIIILIKDTNIVPITLKFLARSGAIRPKAIPAITAIITAI